MICDQVDGRCKTFDVRANGYARAEALVSIAIGSYTGFIPSAVTLQPTSVRADGRSASLTAPNGSAQQRMVSDVWAFVVVSSLMRIEAHGTGTALGDPTEVNALSRSGTTSLPVAIGSHKGNTGHAEAPAGLLGVLAALCRIKQQSTHGNCHLRRINPLVAQSSMVRSLWLSTVVSGAASVEIEAYGVTSM